MKKTSSFILALLGASSVMAGTSTSVAVTSDYIWRGQTQTNHSAAVQGSLEYNWKFLTAGAWLSNVTSELGNTEIDLYISAKKEIMKDFSVALGVTNFTYKKLPANNTMEYSLTLENNIANLFVGYTDDYFAKDSSSMYYNLSRDFTLSKKDNLGLSLAVGMTTFDDEVKVGSKNYMDYKVAVTKTVNNMSYEFFYTDTDRKEKTAAAETETKDSTVGASLSFSL